MGYTIIHSAEEGLESLEAKPLSGDSFELAISNSFTFGGHADTMGAGMAVLLDEILGLGYEPDGFEEMDGFKIHRYKKMEYAEADRSEKGFRFLDLSATPVSVGPPDEETTVLPVGWFLLWAVVVAFIGLLLWIIL
jgi:hypothetical protein